MLTLQELIQKANLLVNQIGSEITDIIKRKQFKGEVQEIISFLKDNQNAFELANQDDYENLATALAKRRTISLQATHAALHKLLTDDSNSRNILDNLESNLQSEKNSPKGNLMADSEELSQDDIEALLAGNDPKNASKKDDISNDDIEALLNEVDSKFQEPTNADSGQMSQDDIEALLNGGNNNSESDTSDIESLLGGGSNGTENAEMSQDEIEALLSGNDFNSTEESRVESDQISEDDIQSLVDSQNDLDDIQALLDAQKEQESADPLVSALGANSLDSEETRIPNDVFPSSNLNEILSEEQEPTPIPKAQSKNVFGFDQKSPSQFVEAPYNEIELPTMKASNQPITNNESETAYKEYQSHDKDIREKVLQDVFALYVNTGGKPILQAECKTKDDIKKAYLIAMQSFPQNALFIEKISRKEIIVVKETREIVNLKINISFE